MTALEATKEIEYIKRYQEQADKLICYLSENIKEEKELAKNAGIISAPPSDSLRHLKKIAYDRIRDIENALSRIELDL